MQPVKGRPVWNSPRGSLFLGTQRPEKHPHKQIHFCLKGVKSSKVMAAVAGCWKWRVVPGGVVPLQGQRHCGVAPWLLGLQGLRHRRALAPPLDGCAVLSPALPSYCKINSGWVEERGRGQSLSEPADGGQPSLNLT